MKNSYMYTQDKHRKKTTPEDFINQETYEKNFIRSRLLKLKKECAGKPIILQGIFRTDREIVRGRCFFTHIKIYSPVINKSKLLRLTEHLMIKVPAKLIAHLRKTDKGLTKQRRSVYIVGYLEEYYTCGVLRCGLRLAFDITNDPIWLACKCSKIDKTLYNQCYQPDYRQYLKPSAISSGQ